MTSRVALATCAALPELYADDQPLVAALASLGVTASPAVWSGDVDWSAYDLVVVRSCWDYTDRRAEFLAWAASVPRLANPADVLAWNTDKRYLGELAAAGVPVVPTTFVAPGESFEVPAYEHVVKPTVSAGGRDTVRYAAGQSSAAHAQALLDAGRHVMVQPYATAVDTEGETSVLSFGGVVSHAARKAPVLVGDGAVDPGEVAITPREASAAELALAASALAAVPFEGSLLYARVDMVPGADGSPVLMELELVEPCLFLATSPGAVDRFAGAVVAALG